MMSEKIISIFGLIFVTSFVAKYVGPTIFGDIALAMSIFSACSNNFAAGIRCIDL